MTADNPRALVPAFQGNDEIQQSIQRSFGACLALLPLQIDTAQMQSQRKRRLLRIWHYNPHTDVLKDPSFLTLIRNHKYLVRHGCNLPHVKEITLQGINRLQILKHCTIYHHYILERPVLVRYSPYQI